MIRHSPNHWHMCFVAENQVFKLEQLINDLMRPTSETGDEKRIESGLSYWGIGPTVAWQKACNDPLYSVMQKSIEKFGQSFGSLMPTFVNSDFHYVSLGVGTGKKDSSVLRLLLRNNPELLFIPIDMSPSMLALGVNGVTETVEIERDRVIPIQMDFSTEANIEDLRNTIRKMVGSDRVLYSLLGNTLANFDNDLDLLTMLGRLLRRQDRLIVEIATTRDTSQSTVNRAATEYSRSPLFRKFVTSALLGNTDLRIRDENVSFVGNFDPEEQSIRIKAIYTSLEDTDLSFSIPDQQRVDFPKSDTIRLYLSRKYTSDGISQLFQKAGLHIIGKDQYPVGDSKSPFGMCVLVAAPVSAMVFISHGTEDAEFVAKLKALLVECGIDPWVAEQDLVGNEKLQREIEAAVRHRQNIILVLSAHSLGREWVNFEVRIAMRQERESGGTRRLFVVRLTEMAEIERWKCFEQGQGDLANKVRENYIYDFKDWQNAPESAPDWLKLKGVICDRTTLY